LHLYLILFSQHKHICRNAVYSIKEIHDHHTLQAKQTVFRY